MVVAVDDVDKDVDVCVDFVRGVFYNDGGGGFEVCGKGVDLFGEKGKGWGKGKKIFMVSNLSVFVSY